MAKRKCVCCGNEYEYCVNRSTGNQPAWKAIYCSNNCREIYNIIGDYRSEKISQETTKDLLDCLNTNLPETANKIVLRVIEELYKAPEKSEETIEVVPVEQINDEKKISRRKKKTIEVEVNEENVNIYDTPVDEE